MGVVFYRENEEQSKRIVFRLFDVKLILLLPTFVMYNVFKINFVLLMISFKLY